MGGSYIFAIRQNKPAEDQIFQNISFFSHTWHSFTIFLPLLIAPISPEGVGWPLADVVDNIMLHAVVSISLKINLNNLNSWLFLILSMCLFYSIHAHLIILRSSYHGCMVVRVNNFLDRDKKHKLEIKDLELPTPMEWLGLKGFEGWLGFGCRGGRWGVKGGGVPPGKVQAEQRWGLRLRAKHLSEKQRCKSLLLRDAKKNFYQKKETEHLFFRFFNLHGHKKWFTCLITMVIDTFLSVFIGAKYTICFIPYTLHTPYVLYVLYVPHSHSALKRCKEGGKR